MLDDLAQVNESTKKLTEKIDIVLNHVENVLNGSVNPDNSLGRSLLDMVQSVPKLNSDDLEEMLNSNMKVCNYKIDNYFRHHLEKKSSPTVFSR